MKFNNRRQRMYIDLKEGIKIKGEEDVEKKSLKKEINEDIDDVDGVSLEDFGVEVEDKNTVGSLEEFTEEERKIIEEAKIKEYEEQILKEIEEKKKKEEELNESAFSKFISKFRKSDKTSSVVEIDEEILKKHGYPKKVIDPTDVEYDKDGNPQYFFNVKKTLLKHNLTWIMDIIGEEKLVNMTYDDDFLDSYADKQHRRAVNYNNMTPTEQYLHDRKRKRIKVSILASVIILISSFVAFNKIPQGKIRKAEALYNAEQYEEAYDLYGNIKGDKAKYYRALSFIKASVENEDFEAAKEAGIALVDSGLDKGEEESSVAVLNDVYYKEGLFYYKKKDFANAKKSFSEILNYKDSNSYYNKSAYSIAEGYLEENDIVSALNELYNIKNYEDAKEKFDKIAEAEYNKAINLYNKKEFDSAKKAFEILSKFNYKNSSAMIEQCDYKKGLDLFLDEKYDEAILALKSNNGFKDSQSIINESIYRKANSMLLTSPAKANIELSKIRSYRDVDDLLKLPILNLYGEWTIIRADDNVVNEETFVFNGNRKIISEKPIKNLRVSSPGDDVSYDWQSNKFVSEDELSSIEVVEVGDDKLTLIATNQGSSTKYECVRKRSLYEYMGLDKEAKIEQTETIDKDIDGLLDKVFDTYVE